MRESSETKLYCPICGSPMDIGDEVSADSLTICVASCPDCHFWNLLSDLDNPEMMTKRINFHLGTLLRQIARGEKAKEIINHYPVFPYNRVEVLRSLMSLAVPSPLNYPGNKSLSVMSEEDIELVLAVLD